MFHVYKEVRTYVTPAGKPVFEEWLAALRDRKSRTIILARIKRLSLGLAGDWRSVGDGVCELRIHFGPGYRIYYAEHSGTIILLLCGGDKSTQDRDIMKAKEYIEEYRRRP